MVQRHNNGVKISGFYTEEVRGGRDGGRGREARIGFDVVTLSGERGRLARISLNMCTEKVMFLVL